MVILKVWKNGGRREVAGKIKKKFAGQLQEYFTNADNFTISFKKNLEPKLKAGMIAAAILIVYIPNIWDLL